MFYNFARVHQPLRVANVCASEMTFPPYATAGEFTVNDPDRHVLMIGQVL